MQLRLVEACARPGCLVCHCLREAAHRHLAAVLREHVTDPLTRGRLARAAGLCAPHAAALGEMPDAALGTAIVYQELVERACRWLDETAGASRPPVRRRGWRTLIGRPRGTMPPRPLRERGERCPVCVELVAVEGSHLDALLSGLADPALATAYAGSDGLCLPHLALALERAGVRSQAARLVDLTRPKLRALADNLRRFVNKHDHRIRPAFTHQEAAAWRQALALLAGRPELFGPEMERNAARRAMPGPSRRHE